MGGPTRFVPYVDMAISVEQVVLVSQQEAARLLGVERTTIWRMCRRGELAQVHIGRRSLITRTSLDAFVNDANGG